MKEGNIVDWNGEIVYSLYSYTTTLINTQQKYMSILLLTYLEFFELLSTDAIFLTLFPCSKRRAMSSPLWTTSSASPSTKLCTAQSKETILWIQKHEGNTSSMYVENVFWWNWQNNLTFIHCLQRPADKSVSVFHEDYWPFSVKTVQQHHYLVATWLQNTKEITIIKKSTQFLQDEQSQSVPMKGFWKYKIIFFLLKSLQIRMILKKTKQTSDMHHNKYP